MSDARPAPSPTEVAHAFGWLEATLRGYRADDGRDEPMALALLASGLSILLARWAPERARAATSHMIGLIASGRDPSEPLQ